MLAPGADDGRMLLTRASYLYRLTVYGLATSLVLAMPATAEQTSSSAPPPPSVAAPAAPPVAVAPAAKPPGPNPIAKQPLYADIVKRATRLKTKTDSFAARPSTARLQGKAFSAYGSEIQALARLDMQAHYDLIKRGTDRDLKCILMGVSRDLPIKLDAIKAAKDEPQLKTAFKNMSDLLDDNVGLITTPATADSGVDCTLEFGKDANALPAS